MRRLLLPIFALLALAACQQATATRERARSPHWPSVRAAHLRAEPACAWCGGTENLEVHHILPVHLYPKRELDDSNLITLCRPCHVEHGHCGDPRCLEFNRNIRNDCLKHKKEIGK